MRRSACSASGSMSMTCEATTPAGHEYDAKTKPQPRPTGSRSSPNRRQREPSVWMVLAVLQSLFWMFGIPALCRKHVWDDLFGALIASHPTYGHEIAELVLLVPIPPVFFFGYTLAMIPIYAGRYPFFEQYRIQGQACWPWFDPRPKVREDFWKLTIRSIKLSSFNMLLLVPALGIVKLYADREIFHVDKTFLFSTHDDHWPSAGENLRDILSLVLVHEFGFYVTHRLSHSYAFLYEYHKIHHEYRINTVLAAQHNHPMDYVLSIAAPALLAISLVPGAHSVSQFQYLLWVLSANMDDHVGYAFPWSPVRWFPGSAATDEHEFHHLVEMGCYASKLSCFNHLLGGYGRYREKRDSVFGKGARGKDG